MPRDALSEALKLRLVWRRPKHHASSRSWHIRAISWSPDGEKLAVSIKPAFPAEKIVVFEHREGGFKEVLRTAREFKTVNAIAWSPDSRYLAFGSCLHTKFIILDVLERKLVYKGRRHGCIKSAIWSRDGKFIVIAGADFIALYDFKHNSVRKLWEIGPEKIKAKLMLESDKIKVRLERVLFSGDKIYAIGGYYCHFKQRQLIKSYALIAIVDLEGGIIDTYTPIELGLLDNEETWIVDADFSPNQRYLAMATHYLEKQEHRPTHLMMGRLSIYRVVDNKLEKIKEINPKHKQPSSLTWISNNIIAIGDAHSLELYKFRGEELERIEEYELDASLITWIDYSSKHQLLAVGTQKGLYIFRVIGI